MDGAELYGDFEALDGIAESIGLAEYLRVIAYPEDLLRDEGHKVERLVLEARCPDRECENRNLFEMHLAFRRVKQ